jgi:hypothetical protein
MGKSLIAFGILAVVGFLFSETPQGHAQSWQMQSQVESDIDGMDHSRLNHGVLGKASSRTDDYQQANLASDPDVIGMDHSKLNHGVLGAASLSVGSKEDAVKVVLDTPPASIIPPLSSWAPPAEIADKVSAAKRQAAAQAAFPKL